MGKGKKINPEETGQASRPESYWGTITQEIKTNSDQGGWLRAEEHLLLSQRTRVRFPALMLGGS